MSAFLPRAVALGWCALSLAAAPSCYRAEIDLSQLTDEAIAGNSVSSSGSSGISDSGEGGASGGAGAGGDSGCNDTLDPEQESCRTLGPATPAQCLDMDPVGFKGCYSHGCGVCEKMVENYEYYFKWHPCCSNNYTCGPNVMRVVRCNPLCPEPTERDKRPPCFQVAVAP